jgi:hypothetical protein
MADPTPFWTINPPTPTTVAGIPYNQIDKLPDEPSDVDISWLDPGIIQSHTRYWFPDMTGWRVGYGKNGLTSCQQSWVAPWKCKVEAESTDDRPTEKAVVAYLPVVLRQMLSWNRERYSYYNKFWDMDLAEAMALRSHGKNQYRNLVITDIELIPRTDLLDTQSESKIVSDTGTRTSLGVMSNSGDKTRWDKDNADVLEFTRMVQQQLRMTTTGGIETDFLKLYQQPFPRIRSQFWQINITWQPDPYQNRYGIRYAKIDIQPSLRMESLKNVPMGVVPTRSDGQPEFTLIDPNVIVIPKGTPGGDQSDPGNMNKLAPVDYMGKPEWIQPISTGFPVREPQITFKVSYPWVSLKDLLNAGPIGNPGQLESQNQAGFPGEVGPLAIPEGLYIGCVNRKSFLGYSRGRVLYSSAEITESTSPITGKIGYEVTHEFIVNPNMEWNQTRYTGDYLPVAGEVVNWYSRSSVPTQIGLNSSEIPADTKNPSFKTGYVVQMLPTSGGRRVHRVAMTLAEPKDWQAVYPYPYKEFKNLLYYGMVGDKVQFDPEITIEG